MRSVWKIVLNAPVVVSSLPSGARVLTVATENGQPCVWLEVDTTGGQREERTFVGHGTGHPIPSGETYLGTAHDVDDAGLVFHIYERDRT